MSFKLRFAPSPTGLLHVGNARSAVLNWVYTMNKGGVFVLRLDDTDKTRSTKEFEDSIKEDLSWPPKLMLEEGIQQTIEFYKRNKWTIEIC